MCLYIWDFPPHHQISHQSEGSWPSRAKFHQCLAAVQSAFSAFSWAAASLQAAGSPTGCSGRFIFPALLFYWMGSVKLKGWSNMLTLPRWRVQFAHGSSLLKIFASKVLWRAWNESIQHMAACCICRKHAAFDNLVGFPPPLLPCMWFSLWDSFMTPEAFGTWLKKWLYCLKNDWELREDVFFSPGKLWLCKLRYIAMYGCI